MGAANDTDDRRGDQERGPSPVAESSAEVDLGRREERSLVNTPELDPVKANVAKLPMPQPAAPTAH